MTVELVRTRTDDNVRLEGALFRPTAGSRGPRAWPADLVLLVPGPGNNFYSPGIHEHAAAPVAAAGPPAAAGRETPRCSRAPLRWRESSQSRALRRFDAPGIMLEIRSARLVRLLEPGRETVPPANWPCAIRAKEASAGIALLKTVIWAP